MRAEQTRMVEDYQRQLGHVQKTADANAERTRKRMEAEMADLKKTAEADADRTRKRMEAEIADLQSQISRLQADLAKVSSRPLDPFRNH